jgi:hypothetical protein
MKGGDEDLTRDFRDRAYNVANLLERKKKQRLNFVLLNSFSC